MFDPFGWHSRSLNEPTSDFCFPGIVTGHAPDRFTVAASGSGHYQASGSDESSSPASASTSSETNRRTVPASLA